MERGVERELLREVWREVSRERCGERGVEREVWREVCRERCGERCVERGVERGVEREVWREVSNCCVHTPQAPSLSLLLALSVLPAAVGLASNSCKLSIVTCIPKMHHRVFLMETVT